MLEEDFKMLTNQNLVDWTLFSGTCVLITGANGFLPAYMAKTFLKLNTTLLSHSPCRVLALVRNHKHAKEVFSSYLTDPHFTIITQDVSQEIVIPYVVDFIIHAASPASPKYYKNSPLSVIYPNVLGTINTLNLALKNPVKSFLYFSSGEVYGEYAGEIDENAYGFVDPTSLRSCYAESKRMGENLCVSYGAEYGVPVKIVRPFHTYGPGMKLDDGRVFADFVHSVVKGEDIVLTSSGEAKRSFLYLCDAVFAYFLILTKGVNNEAYNVANEQAVVSIKELAQIVVGLFPEKNLSVRYAKAKDSYLASPIVSCDVKTDKIKALGWNPTTSIAQGFTKTIRSYL
ncbi:nucleotide sugar dehydratase [Helicobacter cinaedi]|uniref:NAD-dependent epimerase/dehydratase family protein n=1 Tax=Helicobacter cinaedi TaxID=213 RepID=UPI001EEF6CBC|nr:NAD-dependent epimerase/dehydratase family protein [Helicobacter cinaedi]BDB67091.1 nucleotide sugar dehydratase [Helicobacter cinaedi]